MLQSDAVIFAAVILANHNERLWQVAFGDSTLSQQYSIASKLPPQSKKIKEMVKN